jgi:hypothetical protein
MVVLTSTDSLYFVDADEKNRNGEEVPHCSIKVSHLHIRSSN